MLFMVRFDITQPASMSTDQLWKVWNEEAKAALGAKEAPYEQFADFLHETVEGG